MIDKEARKQAAEIVRHFITGQMTNFDFEETRPTSKDDVIWAIWQSLWCFYDDFSEHKLAGTWRLPQETKAEMTRWIMFLHGDEEYEWPAISWPGVRPLAHGFFSRLFKGPEREQKFMQAGDYSVWPFISVKSYEQAKRNPVLLAGID
jgi:hypothetical protein